MFSLGVTYSVCYPNANPLDVMPTYWIAFGFWFLAALIVFETLVIPVISDIPIPKFGLWALRIFFVSAMLGAMASMLTVASATDGFLGNGDKCNVRMTVWMFPLSN